MTQVKKMKMNDGLKKIRFPVGNIFKCDKNIDVFCVFFQRSLCVRKTLRLWRPSATWQQLSGSCHLISPMLGSRIREQSPTSPWW